MKSNAGCWRQRLVGLAIGMSFLSACATGSFKPAVGVCPPVIEYSREFQARADQELTLLPEGSAISAMLIDYTVIRKQVKIFKC